MDRVRSLIKVVPDFPKPGIQFQDIFPVFQDPDAVAAVIDALEREIAARISNTASVAAIVGLDARGFLFGPMLAARLRCAFVPVRKRGKLPGEVVRVSYEKEYGVDEFEMPLGALRKGDAVVVLDDLLATGGSAGAACELVELVGAKVLLCAFMIELIGIGGRQALAKRCPEIVALIEADG